MTPLIPLALLFTISLTIWLLWSRGFWTIPNPTRQMIARRKRRITDRKPTKRAAVIKQTRPWLEKRSHTNAEMLAKERAAVGTEADEQHVREAAERADGMRGFARVLIPFEVAGQYALCLAWLPLFVWWLNLAIALLIVIAIWAFIYRAFRMWDDPDTPTLSIRVARWTTGIASTIAAIGGLIYAVARFAAPGFFASFEGLIFASLIALAEIGPIAAGAASFGAWVAGKPVRSAALIAGLEEEREELTAFALWLDDQSAQLSAAQPPAIVPHLVRPEATNA